MRRGKGIGILLIRQAHKTPTKNSRLYGLNKKLNRKPMEGLKAMKNRHAIPHIVRIAAPSIGLASTKAKRA